MSSPPPSRLVALYEWTTYLMPEQHRRTYGEEQVRLFEQVWREECPSGMFARLSWSARLLVRSAMAALGARLDQWRRGDSRRRAFGSGGGSMRSDFRFTIRSVKARRGMP